METVGSTRMSVSTTELANPGVDIQDTTLTTINGHLTMLVQNVNDGKGIGALLIALKIIEEVNKKIHAFVTTENAETLRVMSNVLKGYCQCNEETLALVDFLTTSKAKLQDTFAYYKEVGHEAKHHPEAIQNIKDWIAKAKEVQKRDSPGETKTTTDQLVLDMNEKIDACAQSYKKLLGDINSIAHKLDSRKRGLVIWYRLLVGVAGVACLAVAKSVYYLCASLNARVLHPQTVGFAFATNFVAVFATFKAFDWVDRFGDAIKRVNEAQKEIEEIKEPVGGFLKELKNIASIVEDMEKCIAQVEGKISGLDDNITGVQEGTTDHDTKQNLIQHGCQLVKECDDMQKEFIQLEVQIELLPETSSECTTLSTLDLSQFS